jgi:hypothetical protein
MENTNTKRVQLKPNPIARELWPLVKDEKKQNGTPAFASPNSVGYFIRRGYHTGHIHGQQPNGKNHALWVDKQDAIDHVFHYLELVKIKNKVFFPVASGHSYGHSDKQQTVSLSVSPVVAAVKWHNDRIVAAQIDENIRGYVAAKYPQYFLGDHEYPVCAAAAALKQLGAQVFRESATTGELKEVL